jgi:hypothetical protein
VTVYVPEDSRPRKRVLRRYFTTSTDRCSPWSTSPRWWGRCCPLLALARACGGCSSTSSGDLDVTGDASIGATVGLRRAEELYEQVFVAYGDDSVAQLGGVHLACEQASSL